MQETGTRNAESGAAAFGLDGSGIVFWNLTEAALYERSIARGETRLSAAGTLTVETGPTATSLQDRYIVREDVSEAEVWWGANQPIGREAYDTLRADLLVYAAGRSLFAQDLFAGAEPAYRVNVRAYCECAWQGLFLRTMLRRPEREELADFIPALTVLSIPGFKADPERHGVRSQAVIALDLARGEVLACGTLNAAELKKAVFGYLTHVLPARGVLPLHGAVTVGENGDAALYLGLAGTGKTTLAVDDARTLIGDDEHGWGPSGLFNIEGGCHVSAARLSAAATPELFTAANRFGTVLENVALNGETREPNYAGAHMSNARATFPLEAMPHASLSGRAAAPRTLLMLACDTEGVLPPIARLNPVIAMYHFLSGYSARWPGAEKDGPQGAQPETTFSPCYGAPFLTRHPSVYANQLRALIERNEVTCWLVNTGFVGGPAGTGRRVPLALTRRLVEAAISGALGEADSRTDPYFGFSVPTSFPGFEPQMLNPARNWPDIKSYEAAARRLAGRFVENFERFEEAVDEEVRDACPRLAIAAE
ncbi:phosphoenolpyruvate carboxykinase (ATP) [Ancylobacter sp. 6x-1]|uniref:Phosphoenolpyruvate carboxykinase (ATP) n=1 Tax=Ancylobacter crimeensis TaxID=2579147 RepID=A0ABT0D7G9_9HYPH|nr:phosphoenolpyruvate carboxykinase (ATP) [Ancylobacter crimeensis]MCK0195890.1 phosphoenolpyruvate carboxykinase (ATP) [Ancylobacter crimeensis]